MKDKQKNHTIYLRGQDKSRLTKISALSFIIFSNKPQESNVNDKFQLQSSMVEMLQCHSMFKWTKAMTIFSPYSGPLNFSDVREEKLQDMLWETKARNVGNKVPCKMIWQAYLMLRPKRLLQWHQPCMKLREDFTLNVSNTQWYLILLAANRKPIRLQSLVVMTYIITESS